MSFYPDLARLWVGAKNMFVSSKKHRKPKKNVENLRKTLEKNLGKFLEEPRKLLENLRKTIEKNKKTCESRSELREPALRARKKH